MAGTVDLHEGEVAAGLDLAVLIRLLVIVDVKALDISTGKVLVTGPLELVSPSLVSEPVADEISIASVNKDGDLVEDLGNKLVVGLHPVTGEEEVAVDIHVAAVVVVNLDTEFSLDVLLVEIIGDPAKARVAEVAAILAAASNVVNIAASALVRTHHGVVAVDAGGDARPGAARLVAALDEALAAGKSVVHGLALALGKD